MKQRWLIGERIKFTHYVGWGSRRWYVNGQYHRDDDGPAFEDVDDDYRSWWEYGSFIRNNQ